MFADFFVAHARIDNRAQQDLGRHMVHADQIIKGENASYEPPKKVIETKTIEVIATSDWGTTTGWYALPDQPVTLTRNDNNNLKVSVQLHYSRYKTNRVYEEHKPCRGPIEQYVNRFELKPSESFTFSTPDGGPIYLVINVSYGYISDLLNVKDDSGNRCIYDANCSTVANGDRYTVRWESNGYAFANSFRMAFFIQLALQIDKMEMGNGKILNSDFDIYTLLYLHGRIFDKHNRNETDWLHNRDQLGFSEFAYAGAPTYGSANTVAKIPGNDFTLVSLSHLSKRDWRPFFDVFGLRYSDLAAEQVAINASNGPVKKGLYQLNTELPDATISSGPEFLDLSTATKDTVWFDDGSPAQCGQ